MHTPTFEIRETTLGAEADALATLVQPGYIVLDIASDELENPDERFFKAVAEEQIARKLTRAILDLGVDGYGFVPSLRFITFSDAELTTIEVDGSSTYAAKVVEAAQQLGLKDLRA